MQRCILLAIFVLAAMSASVQPSYASVGCTTELANCYQRAASKSIWMRASPPVASHAVRPAIAWPTMSSLPRTGPNLTSHDSAGLP